MLSFYLMIIESENDKKKLERLYLEYKDIMQYTAYGILKDNRAEDAVHEAFIKIIEIINDIEEKPCHKTRVLFVIIVKNICLDMIKRKDNTHDSFDDMVIELPDDNLPEDEIITNENIKLIKEKILELPFKYKSVIELHYNNDYSTKQIAKFLSISHDTARQRLSRARKQLLNSLSKGGLLI